MDQKTYEYMSERTKKYHDLSSKKKNLVFLQETITSPKCNDIQFYVDGNYRAVTAILNPEQKKDFKAELSALIEKYVAELDKEMEAI